MLGCPCILAPAWLVNSLTLFGTPFCTTFLYTDLPPHKHVQACTCTVKPTHTSPIPPIAPNTLYLRLIQSNPCPLPKNTTSGSHYCLSFGTIVLPSSTLPLWWLTASTMITAQPPATWSSPPPLPSIFCCYKNTNKRKEIEPKNKNNNTVLIFVFHQCFFRVYTYICIKSFLARKIKFYFCCNDCSKLFLNFIHRFLNHAKMKLST